MPAPILATKLYIPAPRPQIVPRPRLLERLNQGLARTSGVTLISAPAGFGKTTLVRDWIANLAPSSSSVEPWKIAWLSVDDGDNDPARFLTYLVAAVQTVAAHIGSEVMALLQSPQPPSSDWLLTNLLNEIAAGPDRFIVVLDDYHVIEAEPVDQALAFLVEHLPPQLQLVIATREDPPLPLARLRARGQLVELRANDLRFTPAEAAEFLTHTMGLALLTDDITALEQRTEGWIAGLQLAAISLQGQTDAAQFIQSFTGSHHFVLDYLVEEVLRRQPESIQAVLLRTSILDRLCGSLCDAVVRDPAVAGQITLEYLERANLFVVPLDNERQWYRYHHLFRDLLRQRLVQHHSAEELAELHLRASQWYEDQGQGLEAFRHATAANDIDRAERLMIDRNMPLHYGVAVNTILEWLASLPRAVLDTRPRLWVRSATMLLLAGQATGVEDRLQAAEAAMHHAELDDATRQLLIGQIACARATLALTQYQPEIMLQQSRRALEYLPAADLSFRFTANWLLSNAYLFQGDRTAAGRALTDAVAICQLSGDTFSSILALDGLALIQELENQLQQAAATYQRALQLETDQPHPNAAETHLGLARIYYEWDDLAAAERHGRQSLHLAQQYDRMLDRFILSETFLARLMLAQGDVDGAAAALAQTDRAARARNFAQRLPEIAAVRVLVLLRQGAVAEAAQLAQAFDLPVSQARVLLAQNDAAKALVTLDTVRHHMEAKGWQDELLRVFGVQAVALHMNGDIDQALRTLNHALTLAEPGGFIRLFIDEGEPMRVLLADFRSLLAKKHADDHQLIGYVEKLLAAFPPPLTTSASALRVQHAEILDPLSPRELAILQLIAQGLSNREISERLFLALDTVKGHNRRIFDKLQVKSRTEAIARARELGLL